MVQPRNTNTPPTSGAPSSGELKENTTTSTAPVNTVVVPAKEETVVIKKSVLEDLMARLDRVEAVADKGQLAHFDSKNKGKMGKVVKLRAIDGKVVLSWDNMVKNTVERNQLTGVWKEDQVVKLKLEDGTEVEIDYVLFSRRFTNVFGTVIKESRDMETDDVLYTIKSDDGRVYEDINIKFIN